MENNEFSLDFSYSQEDVNAFAQVSGDYNPIHLDAVYASTTIFKRTIIHGYLGSSVFSRIFGTLFPGIGTIYLKQELKFLAPMFVDQNYTAKVTVLDVISEKKRARCCTQIFNDSGKIVIDGEALIQHESYGNQDR